jgi:hypothetical protein
MVLAHVIATEACLVVELDQLQALFVLLGKWVRPVVVLVEYAELKRIERRHGHLQSIFPWPVGRVF